MSSNQTEEKKVNSPAPISDFVHVNGIRLHYLDWGGEGPVLIFLSGRGSSAYIYSNFAPRFNDRFHVLALTRRGHGDSDYPETGYDADTLTEDICQFMDKLNIHQAVFAGHSLAGVELTHLAATHPERIEKLVYLDALDDRRGFPAIRDQNPIRKIKIDKEPDTPHTLEEYIADMKRDIPEFAKIWSDLWDEEIAHSVTVNDDGIYVDKTPQFIEDMITENLIQGYAPKKVEAKIPMLCFYALGMNSVSDVFSAEQKASYDEFQRKVGIPFQRSLISEFQNRFPHAKIILLPEGHHYCFIAQEEQVYREMQKFLLE